MEDTHLLKILSELLPGEKICFRGKEGITVVKSSSWSGTIFRYWNEESRKETLQAIMNMIERICSKEEITEFEEEILPSVQVGIRNLISTYAYDHPSCLALQEFDFRIQQTLNQKKSTSPLHQNKIQA